MKKFGVKDQIAYALGDTGGSFVNIYVDAYFMVFCTYVLKISPFFMGNLFLIVRLWAAVNDPIMGSITDRFTIGKSGERFKPYIKIFMIPLAVSGILCFTDVSNFSNLWKQVWVSMAYVLFALSYTGASLPYGSLASVVSSDPVERTKLSRARSLGCMVVNVSLAVVPQFVWRKSAEGTQEPVAEAFMFFAIIFGIGSLLAYTGLLAGTTERVRYETSKSGYSYRRILAGVLKNRPLIGAMVATLGSLIALSGANQFGSFLWKEYYNMPQMVTYVMLINMPITLLLFAIVPRLVQKYGKRSTILAPTTVGLAASMVMFFIPIANPWIFFVLNIVATLGNSMFTMLVWALVTDCMDYQEYMTGEHADGSVYSIFTFARKIGSALASTAASYILGWIGYNSQLTTQSAEVSERIRMLYAAILLVTCILMVIGLGMIFNLKKEESDQISAELKLRRKM